jgi:hypothetical protein
MRGPLSPAFTRRLDSASGPNLCALRDLLLFPGNLLTPEVSPCVAIASAPGGALGRIIR